MFQRSKLTAVGAVLMIACGGGSDRPPVAPTLPSTDSPSPAPDTTAPTPAPVAQAVGKPADNLIPRELLFGNPERKAVLISPDGKHLSWLAPKDGVMNVWVAPVGDLAAARAITSDSARPVRKYHWAHTAQHVLYEQDKAGDENFHLFAADLTTGTSVDLTPVAGARAELYGQSVSRPRHVVVGMNDRDPKLFDAYEVDIATGERKKLVENKDGFIDFVVDDTLAIRLAQKMDPSGEVVMMAPGAKGWTEWARIPAEDNTTTAPIGLDQRGKTLYLVDSRGRNTGALYAVDLASKKKRLLAEDARADITGMPLKRHPRTRAVQAAAVNYDRLQWKIVDPKVKADFTAIAKLSEGDCVPSAETDDDKTWLVTCSGDVKPVRYFVYDRATKKGSFLFSAQPKLDEQPLVRMHPVVIKARDGLDLVSYLSLPATADPDGDGKANAPGPMVLLVHGGPWARDVWGFHPIHQQLANRGYAVLSVNFRGSTGFGKGFVNASNMQWGKKMHDDLLDAVEWAVGAGVAPRDKIGIMGGSYGGYATLAGLTLTPDVFAVGVDIVGPSNIITLLETIPPYWAPLVAMFKTRVGDYTTAEGKQALLAVSPLTHAAKIKRPLLIAQGANDPRVKQTESDQIVKAMRDKNIPVSYVLFPDEGHGFARPENNIAFFAVAEAFLSAHLGGSYQPLPAEFAGSTIEIKTGREGIPGLAAAR
jgi:dipeptidyl aminopeptidase/acylaminoacyl peptidase